MYSVYLHIPFCRHRCAYCDFNTYAGLSGLIPAYVGALCQEIAQYQLADPLPVHTIYFGGGTPSLLPLNSFEQIFTVLRATFNFQPATEISLEANPGTLSLDYLRGLRAIGFNRISLGMQSARPNELRFLERQHNAQDVVRAVQWAWQAGFDNLNLDLIYGLPGQALSDWEYSLSTAIRLEPQHLSLYALTIEDGTPLHSWARRGLVDVPDADLAADMYDLASAQLADAGFVQYEISNWAVNQQAANITHPRSNPTYACTHNLQYWRNQPYLGLGAGAHGYFRDRRSANILHPVNYISQMNDPQPMADNPLYPAAETITLVSRADEKAETMMMGLRLTREGVSDDVFFQRFGEHLMDVYAQPIGRLIDLGLLEWADEALRLTVRGHLLGNQVFVEFI